MRSIDPSGTCVESLRMHARLNRERAIACLADPLGQTDGGDPARLGADDVAGPALTPADRILQQVLGHLCGLAATCAGSLITSTLSKLQSGFTQQRI